MANEPEEKKHIYVSKFPDNPLTPEKMRMYIEGKITPQELYDVKASQLLAIAQLGEIMIQSGKLGTAQTLFEGLAALNPHLGSFHTALGGIYMKQGELEKALAEYSRAIDRNDKDVGALVNRGEIYLRSGRLEDASKDLGRAIQLEDNVPTEKKSPECKRAIVLALALKETVAELQRQMAEGKDA